MLLVLKGRDSSRRFFSRQDIGRMRLESHHNRRPCSFTGRAYNCSMTAMHPVKNTYSEIHGPLKASKVTDLLEASNH
jgi:hypothetical protein